MQLARYLVAALLFIASPVFGSGFMMYDAYKLEPGFSSEYKHAAMQKMAANDTAAIVYVTLGYDDRLGLVTDALEHAAIYGTDVWLQIRAYDNAWGFNSRQLPKAKGKLTDTLKPILDVYSKLQEDCKIILFEEAGIYHSPIGGGKFWADGNRHYAGERLRASSLWDSVFIYRFNRVFDTIKNVIRTQIPDCEVGWHIGHAATYREYKNKRVIEHLTVPDFIMYDLYPKVSPTYASFQSKLIDRIPALAAIAPVYYLNQLHTTNYFAHGGGRTPSFDILHNSMSLARQLGAHDLGWYTKNARATINFSENPFDPNTRAQTTVLDSSPTRYSEGLRILNLY